MHTLLSLSLSLLPLQDAESVKAKEAAIGRLTELLVKQQDAAGLAALLTELRPLFNAIPKAKTAKLVRTVIDSIARVPGSTQLQVRAAGGRVGGRRGLFRVDCCLVGVGSGGADG